MRLPWLYPLLLLTKRTVLVIRRTTFSTEGSGTGTRLGQPSSCPSHPSLWGWMQRGRRGACVIRGEKPQAIASHGTGSGKSDVVAIPQPFSPTAPRNARSELPGLEPVATTGAALSAAWHCGSLRARPCSVGRLLKGPSRSCRKSHPAIRNHSRRPQRAPLSARADRVVPVFSHGVTVRIAAGCSDSSPRLQKGDGAPRSG